MFRKAIVRAPCRSLAKGLSTAGLGAPDYELALAQHAAYVDALRRCGVDVTILPPSEDLPDSVFVEDAALCTPHNAVITRPGAESRRAEAELMAPALARFYRNIDRIEAPGTLDAGDVMMAGSHFFIGISGRTNVEGARQLIAILERRGMTGSTIEVGDMLHLKTGLAYLEEGNVLAAPDLARSPDLARFNVVRVAPTEVYAGNSIWVNGRVIMPFGYPETRSRVASLGYEVIEVDTSEFRKLDGGVSCLSLRF